MAGSRRKTRIHPAWQLLFCLLLAALSLFFLYLERRYDPAGNASSWFDLSMVPPYSGAPYAVVNGNRPGFGPEDRTTVSFESYGPLDRLGRCTVAYACAGPDLMPTGSRESISSVRPTGWHLVKYAGIDGNYLYNRCHLIAYGLTAENANERNLITGTRYMNTLGMNDFENRVIGYIRRTGHHVLYRATPVFEGDNLVASGILLEGESVEDGEIRFCIFAYNVQPGITIDYATGYSSGPEFTGAPPSAPGSTAAPRPYSPPAPDTTFVVNRKSGKFHLPACPSVPDIRPENRLDVTSSRDELVGQGYTPCGSCRP